MLTESQMTLITTSSTPKLLGAYCEVSGTLLKQTSPAAQAFVMQALARAVVAELSRALLVGTGTNGQIRGIANTPGVGSVPGGTANYATVLNMIETVEAANALLTPEAAGFAMRANVTKLARTREQSTGGGTMMVRNDLAGYPGVVTQGASPNTMTFGDWSQLVLLEYSTLEIGTDPYGANSALFKSGVVGIRCLWSVDAVVLNRRALSCRGRCRELD